MVLEEVYYICQCLILSSLEGVRVETTDQAIGRTYTAITCTHSDNRNQA